MPSQRIIDDYKKNMLAVDWVSRHEWLSWLNRISARFVLGRVASIVEPVKSGIGLVAQLLAAQPLAIKQPREALP